jgi:hypothetical protein
MCLWSVLKKIHSSKIFLFLLKVRKFLERLTVVIIYLFMYHQPMEPIQSSIKPLGLRRNQGKGGDQSMQRHPKNTK